MATPTFAVGTNVIYRHEGVDKLAHVTEVDPATGEVIGISVVCPKGTIELGVSKPKLATTAQHQITDGYFRARV